MPNKRTTNSHAVNTGIKMRQIMAANPYIRPQKALSIASKQVSAKRGSGMYINPYASGSGYRKTGYY